MKIYVAIEDQSNNVIGTFINGDVALRECILNFYRHYSTDNIELQRQEQDNVTKIEIYDKYDHIKCSKKFVIVSTDLDVCISARKV